MTFEVADADWKADRSKIVDSTRVARIAPSLGGVETLIEQPLGDELLELLATRPG